MPAFAGRHVVHIQDLSVEDMQTVLAVAERMADRVQKGGSLDLARGRVLANLFFEPSTRTRLSFESAMSRLGGQTLTISEAASTSLAKGETLQDTIRMVASYADAIVLRHPREGAARLAAEASPVPVLNAGDGAGQHPTQTLLDLFTIQRTKGPVGDQRIALLGDLKYGRTVHSLANALARFGAQLVFVAPPALQLPKETEAELAKLGARIERERDPEAVIADADVLYVTRIQKERFPDLEEYRRVAGTYRVTADLVAKGKKGLVVLHPLPRVGEIDPEVDRMPAAKYFEQAANGVPVRMALLSLVLGLESYGAQGAHP
ncbi:MAG TPA: aspartate carbamoyltransferase [Candidatus Thermoplasmatota archaeon]|nr:aspartate carbamoyltransferase [Candidatus Thermoplasmatota archaeon]